MREHEQQENNKKYFMIQSQILRERQNFKENAQWICSQKIKTSNLTRKSQNKSIKNQYFTLKNNIPIKIQFVSLKIGQALFVVFRVSTFNCFDFIQQLGSKISSLNTSFLYTNFNYIFIWPYEWSWEVFNELISSYELQQLRAKSQDNLKSMLVMITILSGFCFLYNAYLIFQWDYKIIIIYSCVSSFTIMVHRLLKSRSLTQYCCFNIFESLLLISYLLSMVYYLEIEKVNINFISYAQLVLQFLILAVTVLVNKSTFETDSQDQSFQIQEILISAFKSIGALQLVFISLRITEQITWGWIQTLIIIWFLLGLSFVICICLFIDILQKCRNKQDGIEEEKKQIIIQGGIWFNFITFGITILPFSTFFGLALNYDFKIKQLNQYAFGLTIIYYLLQLAYYFKFKQKLIDYLQYYDIAQINMSVDQQIQQINQNQQQIENRIEIKIKRMHKISISKVPQFMVKLSQTYYKCAQNAESQNMSSKIQQNQQNQKNKYQENYNDNDQSKRFDLLLSSPRQRLEVSSSIGQDLTSRNFDKKQLEDQSSIKQEQQNQNAQKLCLVCYEKESNMINMPCGHGGFCKECCEQLLSKSELCYLCRKPVTHSLQIQEIQNRESLVEVIEVLEQQNK